MCLSATDTTSLTKTLNKHGVQHMMVEGREDLSGDWLHDVVKTGEVSWRPVHLLLMCSLSCVTAALSKVREKLGRIWISVNAQRVYLCQTNALVFEVCAGIRFTCMEDNLNIAACVLHYAIVGYNHLPLRGILTDTNYIDLQSYNVICAGHPSGADTGHLHCFRHSFTVAGDSQRIGRYH